MDKHEVEASSPLATIEDIHKRLTRPPSQLHSQLSSSSIIAPNLHELQHRSSSQSKLDTSLLQKRYELQHDNSSQPKSKLDTYPLQKRRKSRAIKVTNTERLEDYFDLSLLSTIRAKMNSSMKKQARKMEVKSEFEEFVWPVGDHDSSEVFSENSRRTEEAIVDLINDDDDSFGDGEENHVIGVDPFQRFESTALMRFKR